LLAALFSLGGCVAMSLGLFHLDSPVNPCCFSAFLPADRLSHLRV
jgi:hypothetical protein